MLVFPSSKRSRRFEAHPLVRLDAVGEQLLAVPRSKANLLLLRRFMTFSDAAFAGAQTARSSGAFSSSNAKSAMARAAYLADSRPHPISPKPPPDFQRTRQVGGQGGFAPQILNRACTDEFFALSLRSRVLLSRRWRHL